MTRSKPMLLGFLVVAALSTPVGAAESRLVGKFAFRTDINPDKASCAQLTQATASRLSSSPYKCERTPLSSGKSALSCSGPGGRGSHLVFDTKAACESERKDQEAAE